MQLLVEACNRNCNMQASVCLQVQYLKKRATNHTWNFMFSRPSSSSAIHLTLSFFIFRSSTSPDRGAAVPTLRSCSRGNRRTRVWSMFLIFPCVFAQTSEYLVSWKRRSQHLCRNLLYFTCSVIVVSSYYGRKHEFISIASHMHTQAFFQ